MVLHTPLSSAWRLGRRKSRAGKRRAETIQAQAFALRILFVYKVPATPQHRAAGQHSWLPREGHPRYAIYRRPDRRGGAVASHHAPDGIRSVGPEEPAEPVHRYALLGRAHAA